jgi:sugar phosphate isomerase/epimerase
MTIPNPLLLFDNYFDDYRRQYSWENKLAVVKDAGFDGINFFRFDFESPDWQEVVELPRDSGFGHVGFYVMSDAVIDENADVIDEKIARLRKVVGSIADMDIPADRFVTLSFNGTGELGGPTIAERGSAKAEARHWERGARVTAAFDEACREHSLPGSLYPHIDWLSDTPEAVSRLLQDSGASHIGLGFTALHWHLNSNSGPLDQVLELPGMERLEYVALTNARAYPDGFETRPIDYGEIDLAQILGRLWARGYTGPITTQAYKMGGDPHKHARDAVRYLRDVRERYERAPQMFPR